MLNRTPPRRSPRLQESTPNSSSNMSASSSNAIAALMTMSAVQATTAPGFPPMTTTVNAAAVPVVMPAANVAAAPTVTYSTNATPIVTPSANVNAAESAIANTTFIATAASTVITTPISTCLVGNNTTTTHTCNTAAISKTSGSESENISISAQQVSLLLDKIQSLENQLRDTQAQVHNNNRQHNSCDENNRGNGQPVEPTTSSHNYLVPYAQLNCSSSGQPSNISGASPTHLYTVASQPATTMPNLTNEYQSNVAYSALPCRPPISTNVDYFLNGFRTPQSVATNTNYHVLRKLQDLPEFSGQPEDWPLFSSAFNQSTAAYGYTNLENNQRLLKCLKGEAREVVKSLLIHPDNVGAVMEQLKFRFGRPEWLIRSQLQQLKEISPISESAIEKLIPFASKAKNVSIFLQSVNGTQHLSNPTLLEELVSKLPISKRMDWARYAAAIKPYPTVVDFSNWLSDLANLVCTLQQSDSRRRVVLHAMENRSSQPQPAVKCPICKGQHKVSTCKKFIDSSVADRWALTKQNRLCFSCLRNGHSSRDCRSRTLCMVDGCQRKHNKLLHEPSQAASTTVTSQHGQQLVGTANVVETMLSCSSNASKQQGLLFRVLPVTLFGPHNKIDTYAMLDEGSSITMMDKSLLGKLGIRGEECDLNMQWFGGRTAQEAATVVNLDISGKGMCKRHRLRRVYVLPNLNLPVQSLSDSDLNGLSTTNLPSLPLTYSNVVPMILIGLDHCHLGLPSITMPLKDRGPYAANTELGWVVFGPTSQRSVSSAACLHVSKVSDLHALVEEYFDIDSFGVRPAPALKSNADERAERILRETTIRVNGRFQTGLLWKSDHVKLPDSYPMAKSRLLGIERKFKRDHIFAAAYKEIIPRYIEKGYARKLAPGLRGNSRHKVMVPAPFRGDESQ